jgi:hypothetical protein
MHAGGVVKKLNEHHTIQAKQDGRRQNEENTSRVSGREVNLHVYEK